MDQQTETGEINTDADLETGSDADGTDQDGEFVSGATMIAEKVFDNTLSPRQTYRVLEEGWLPAGKVAGKWSGFAGRMRHAVRERCTPRTK
jgi:hypothetical protein